MTVRQYIGARYVPLFADPIQWDSTSSYEPLTVVMNQGTSYVSKQSVPAGIDITNETYWLRWADYNAQLEEYIRQVQTYSGQITALNEALPITDFDTDNTVKDAINALDTAIDARFDVIEADSWVTTNRIADNAVTQDKLANAYVVSFDTVTDMKASETLAIGDICHTNGFHTVNDGGACWYFITDSGTANERDIIACQNNLLANLVIIDTWVTPEMYGAYGNGTTDDYAALNAAMQSGKILKLGAKTYLTNNPLNFKNSIIGVAGVRMNCKENCGSVIKAGFTSALVYTLSFTETDFGNYGIDLKDFAVDCDGIASGIEIKNTNDRPPFKLNNISVYDTAYNGINIDPVTSTSRLAMLDNISITGGIESCNAAIIFGQNAGDCVLSNAMLMYMPIGIIVNSYQRLENIHMYSGISNVQDIDTYFDRTVGIIASDDFMATNLYIDTFSIAVEQLAASANIGTLTLYNDTFPSGYTGTHKYLLQALNASAKIIVANVFHGGIRGYVGGLQKGNVCVKSLTQEWNEITKHGPLMPILDDCHGGGSYVYTVFANESGNYHHRVARFYVPTGVNGAAVIQLNRLTLASKIGVSINGGSSYTVSGFTVEGFGWLPTYYKEVIESGMRFIDIYIVPYSGEITVTTQGNSIDDNNNHNVVALNITNCALAHVSQSDNTGLTAINP